MNQTRWIVKKKQTLYLVISVIGLILAMILIFSLNRSNNQKNDDHQPQQFDIKNIQASNPFKDYTPPFVPKKNNNHFADMPSYNKQAATIKVQIAHLTKDYTNISDFVNKAMQDLPEPQPSQTPRPQPTPRKTPKPLSAKEKEASQSAVFFPGSAPKPISASKDQASDRSSKDARSNKGYKKTDSNNNDDDNKDSNNQDSDNNNSINSGGYGGGYGGGGGGNFIPIPAPSSSPNTMTMQYTPSDEYNFVYKQSDPGPNPLNQISDDLTLTIKINNPTESFSNIEFCNNQFASCLSSLSLSNASITITTDNLDQIRPSITSSSYSSTAIEIDDQTSNYMVPSLYFLLSTSDSSTKTKANVSFPVTDNCQSNTDEKTATCTLTNSSSASMNISTQGTTDSAS